MPKEVLQEFEKREGIKVVEDTYDSPEAMLSKLQAGGDTEMSLVDGILHRNGGDREGHAGADAGAEGQDL